MTLLTNVLLPQAFGNVQQTCGHADAAVIAVSFRNLLVKGSVSGLGHACDPRGVDAGVRIRRFERGFRCSFLHFSGRVARLADGQLLR